MADLPQNVKDLFNELSLRLPANECLKCGSELMHLEAMFFSLGSVQTWTIPLPFCPKCLQQSSGALAVSDSGATLSPA